MKQLLMVLALVLLTSCGSLDISNNSMPNDKNIGKYAIYKISVISELDHDSYDPADLKSFKETLGVMLASKNVRKRSKIAVDVKVFLKQFKIKGRFARINKILGGYDKLLSSVNIYKKGTSRLIKSYDAKLKHALFSSKDAVFDAHSRQILSPVLGEFVK